MKIIEIKQEGFTWHVPLLAVAENRADHYADDPDTTREEEIAYVMGDSFEGLDWFANNMDFADVRDVATLMETRGKPSEPDCNAETDIIEIEPRELAPVIKEPDAVGYYWAKLVSPRKEPAGEEWASTSWEIVHVDENYGDGDDAWRVYVPGIGPGQLIDAFQWGPRIADTPPACAGAIT